MGWAQLAHPRNRPQCACLQLTKTHPNVHFAIMGCTPITTKQKETAKEGYADLNKTVILEHTAGGVQVGAPGSRQ